MNKNDSIDKGNRHLWEIQWVRDLLVIAGIALILWIGYALRTVTVPLLVALLLAYLFEPLIARIERSRMPVGRTGSVLGIIIGMLITVLLAIGFVVPTVVSQTSSFVGEVASGTFRNRIEGMAVSYMPKDASDVVISFTSVLPSSPESTGSTNSSKDHHLISPNKEDEIKYVDEEVSLGEISKVVEEDFLQYLGHGIELVWTVVSKIIAYSFLVFIIPFYFFFFSISYPRVCSFGESLIPDSSSSKVKALIVKMDNAVAGFVRGRIVISFLMGIMFAFGWWLVGVPYAILLGLITGIFCAIPFLGLVGLPLALIVLAVREVGIDEAERMSWWLILLLPTAVYIFVQGIEGWILTPAIQGKATNLDPVTIFVAVLAGGSVMGAYGMLLAIPIAACMRILITDLFLPACHDWARGNTRDPLPFDSSSGAS